MAKILWNFALIGEEKFPKSGQQTESFMNV